MVTEYRYFKSNFIKLDANQIRSKLWKTAISICLIAYSNNIIYIPLSVGKIVKIGVFLRSFTKSRLNLQN